MADRLPLAQVFSDLARDYPEFKVTLEPASAYAMGVWSAKITIGLRSWTSHSDDPNEALNTAYRLMKESKGV